MGAGAGAAELSGNRPATRLIRRALLPAAGLILCGLWPGAGFGAREVCRYAGTTSHDGQVAVRAEVASSGPAVTVDVLLALTARAWFTDLRYLAQETSTWRDGELQWVALNTRTVVDGRIRRQQWDVFTRTAEGFAARRVQAKTEADFRRLHPGFLRHWDLAAFGQPWLGDYDAALPERRPDLDLPRAAVPPGLRTPLALAFHWSRLLPPGGGAVPVFLPGAKHDARADLLLAAVAPGTGWRLWQGTLRHPALSGAAPSTAEAWVSADGRLLQLAFDARARLGTAQGLLRAQGCEESPDVPPPRGEGAAGR